MNTLDINEKCPRENCLKLDVYNSEDTGYGRWVVMEGLCGCRIAEDGAICEEGAGKGRKCPVAEVKCSGYYHMNSIILISIRVFSNDPNNWGVLFARFCIPSSSE